MARNPLHELNEAREALERVRANLQGPRTAWGPHVWATVHHLMAAIPCPDCQAEGRILAEGIHDIVNGHLGKPLHAPESLCMVHDQARSTLIKAGETRCGVVREARYG